MKKITLLTKIIFHICNTGLIFLYLYPGSIMGWLIYKDFQKQPQITSDFLQSPQIMLMPLLSYLY